MNGRNVTVPVGDTPPATVATSRTGPRSSTLGDAWVEMVGLALAIVTDSLGAGAVWPSISAPASRADLPESPQARASAGR
ncbi:MAG: hypothetical protein ACRD12_10675 [Acidimicrobiales bacterium]